MTNICEFPRSVTEKIGYYVYLLINPITNKVFYVGKGTGNRIFSHMNTALASPLINDKLDEIRSIISSRTQVRYSIIRHGLTEKEAFEVEAALIDYIDILELTNIVAGHDSDNRGLMNINDIIAKYEALKINIIEPSVLLTVNRLYRRNMCDEDLYEITRGNWVIGTRRSKAKYAFVLHLEP